MSYRIAGRLRAEVVTALELDRCPQGAISRFSLELFHNALGQAVCIPVLIAKGNRPGPVFGITGAVHGNEINGIPTVHQLIRSLKLEKLRGTVLCVPVVNVPGFLAGIREFNDGVDLNTIFPGKAHGRDSHVFAYRFCEEVIRHFDYLVDLHTASFGRVNSLYVRADMEEPMASEMASLHRPQIILHNPPSDSTLRGHASAQGIPAITVEVGNPHRYHGEYVRRTLAGLRAVLSHVGMTPKRPRTPLPKPVFCERSYWLYADHGGLLEVYPKVTERVDKHQVVAHLSDVFGEVIRQYRAPESGIVIGKSVHPVGQSGARILHLGIEKANLLDDEP